MCGVDVCIGDVIDAAMTEPTSRDHDSDVIERRPLLTPCEFVIKVETADDDDEDVNDGLDRDAVEQRRSSSDVGAADDDRQVVQQLDITDNDNDVEDDFPSEMASEATTSAGEVLADGRLSSPVDGTTATDRNTPPVSYQQPLDVGRCRVCGDDATGMYFGALVCVPCKVNRNFDTSLNNHCCLF